MVFKISQYGESRRKIGFVWEPKKYHPSRRRIRSRSTECRHKLLPGIENKLYQIMIMVHIRRLYIDLKEETEGTEGTEEGKFTFLESLK
jgi:hypothetical protein